MKNGFTLVEVMIIMAIVGILAVIAIPAYNNATCRTDLVMCEAEMPNAYERHLNSNKGNSKSTQKPIHKPTPKPTPPTKVVKKVVPEPKPAFQSAWIPEDDIANYRVATLKKNNDGQLYACVVDGKCYKIEEY